VIHDGVASVKPNAGTVCLAFFIQGISLKQAWLMHCEKTESEKGITLVSDP
jgi:hypothetical protein